MRATSRVLGWCLAGFVGLAGPSTAKETGTKLLRFPDIHGDRIVFTYAGDLWLAQVAGGTATRLTAHPGVEVFPRFSPDGTRIAFTGQYDGDEQVYVVPASGGIPRQLTFYPAVGPLPARWGFDNIVYDWTPDGTAVLFRSGASGFEIGAAQLFTVSAEGGLPEPLPMPESGAGDLSPNGKQVVYSPTYRDFRTWKRYSGGWAQELYVFDLRSHDLTRVTDHPRADRDPMWIGDRIYFTSDRDGTSNLYAWDVKTRKTEQLTKSTTWDVRWPNDDGRGRIVYELNGELELYDVATRRSTGLAIVVPDDGLWMRPERVSAAERVEGFALSPKGERAVFVARGEIFTVPIEKGPTRNRSETPGAHERWARWSPDGKRIAYVSDATGEDEIWVVAQDGAGDPEQLTKNGRGMRYAAEWSPDGQKLAFGDKEGRVFVLDVASRKEVEVANEPDGQIRDYTWSPDSGYLAFSMTDSMGGFRSIHVWSAADEEARRVTSERFDESSPAWDPEGKYLYFLADHEFAPQISAIEFNYASDRMASIYALALRSDVPHPFPPESDEVEAEGDKKDDKKDDKNDAADESKQDEAKKVDPLRIEFDGLERRVARVPLEADNYDGLAAVKGRLLYVRGAPFYYGRDADVEPSLRTFGFEEREEKTIAEDIRGYTVSRDGSKVLVRHESAYKLYSADPKKKEDPKTVATSGLVVDRVPATEWALIFDEVWRRFRDFFYVENMHGYDWEALREQYRPQLEHVAHRSDLNYVIGEMIAELNVGHAYITGGDWQMPERAKVALPGADLVFDKDAGRYRIAKIFRGHNEEPRYRSPLTEIGVDAREGDYVLAIDGEELGPRDNPYERLRNRADRPVRLTLNAKPTSQGARQVAFDPIDDEDALRYLDWVERNRERVEQLSGGRVGYLHIPDMGADGIREFIKWYYPQIRKLGLVVDARGNGGGNVSQMIIERLRRTLLGVRFSRTFERPGTYPGWTFRGPMACLLDEDSASDGDIFPHMFRQAGLGPLIGKRSWGGVVGITNHGPLVDGGTVNVPQFGTNGLDGSWIIEGHGVDPDIVVENDAKSLLAGRDPQLERAVAEVLQGIEAEDPSLPTQPAPAPVKTK